MHTNAKAAPMAAASHASSPPPLQAGPHQASVDEIVHSFEEADHHEISLAGYQPEDWICLAIFWTMAMLVFLQCTNQNLI